MIDEQHALQMVHLVLQAVGKQSVGFQRLLLAVTVLIFGADARRALYIFPDVGHRQAAFLEGCQFFRRPQDRGIDEGARIPLAVLLVEIHDDDALGDADLHGGQPDAVGLVHGLQHIVDQTADFAVNLGDFARHRFQAGIGGDEDGTNGHGREIGRGRFAVKIPRVCA